MTSKKKSLGMATAEYLVLIVLMVVASITAVGHLGDTVRAKVAQIACELAGCDSTDAQNTATAAAQQAGTEAKKPAKMGGLGK